MGLCGKMLGKHVRGGVGGVLYSPEVVRTGQWDVDCQLGFRQSRGFLARLHFRELFETLTGHFTTYLQTQLLQCVWSRRALGDILAGDIGGTMICRGASNNGNLP